MTADATSARPDDASAGVPRPSDLHAPPARVHLVGAGGAGMRALAVLLADAGYEVDGCDRSGDARAPEITRAGGRLLSGHDAGHLEGVDLVIRSSAVPADHPEVAAAGEREIPVWVRARALGALVNGRRLVGVAGTHGKTTITAMTTVALRAAGLDPTGVVGGRVPAWGGHAVVGEGPAVVEADEYDRSFLELDPRLAVVSSLEPEHLESYGTVGGLESAFRTFAGRAADREGVLFCVDDPGAARLGRSLGGTGYGFGAGAAYRVERVSGTGPSADPAAAGRVRLEAPGTTLELRVAAPGRHNLQNAAAAVAVALRLGADRRRLAGALADFPGVDRRLQTVADAGGVAVVDDYAHHPTEVRASLAAVRERWPDRRVVAVFQPHLFSRTQRFAREFAEALEAADEARVLPIYPAREEPVPGVTSDLVVDAGAGLRPIGPEDVPDRAREAEAGTVLLFMGAGDVTDLASRAAGEVEDRALGV